MPVEADLIRDDEDLPEAPAKTPPKDPATGRFVSTRQEPVVETPTHSQYMLARAQRFGVSDAESMTPAELDRLLLHLERQNEQFNRPKTPEPELPKEQPDEPFNWGQYEDEDGKPLTAETAKQHLSKWQYDSILRSHAAEQRAAKAEKRAAAAEEKLTKSEQERNEARATRLLRDKLATRPDLFGEKPGRSAEGSIEQERYKLVYRYLANMSKEERGATFEADIDRAMAIFGGEPRTEAPAGKPALSPIEAQRRAELARPTARRNGEVLSRREQLIQAKAAELKENGRLVHVPPDGDDDDLPD